MKQSVVIILLLVGQVSSAQWRPDTTISRRTLDSLLQELLHYKDAVKHTYFKQIVNRNTISVDSIFSANKDTLMVANYSNRKMLLQKQEVHFDKAGRQSLLHDTYFDTSGRKLYEEQWHMGYNWENNISGFLQYCYRYHYDSTGKETGMTMESNDGAGHRVQRFYYTIDRSGKKVWGNRVKLNEYAFWD